MRKQKFYQGIKIIGFLSFVPFMLAVGPLSGYFVGDFLRRRWHLSDQAVLFCVAVGFLVGVMEMIRILKLLAKMDKR